jgi:hypothetical protein
MAVLSLTLLAGCGPQNLKDCIDDASRRPTDTGVRLARYECAKQFPAKPNPFDQFDPPKR